MAALFRNLSCHCDIAKLLVRHGGMMAVLALRQSSTLQVRIWCRTISKNFLAALSESFGAPLRVRRQQREIRRQMMLRGVLEVEPAKKESGDLEVRWSQCNTTWEPV